MEKWTEMIDREMDSEWFINCVLLAFEGTCNFPFFANNTEARGEPKQTLF